MSKKQQFKKAMEDVKFAENTAIDHYQYERMDDYAARDATLKMVNHHHGRGTMRHIGNTFKVHAGKYINFSISSDNEVVMTVMESTDSICNHGNRICFCGEWDISSRVMIRT